MAKILIELPQVGESVVEGVIDKWLKKPGDKVSKFDPLVEVVTDKVNMEVPSPYDGVITRILAQEGATIPMGAPIAELETSDPAALQAQPSSHSAPATVPTAPSTPNTIGTLVEDSLGVGPTGGGAGPNGQPSETPAGASVATEERFYSPIVMKLAKEHAIDLAQVKGTGMAGRVTKKDVLEYVESRPKAGVAAPARTPTPAPSTPTRPSADEEEVAVSPIRRTIAQHMARSAAEIPHAWAMIEADVTELVKRRQAVREDFKRREGVDLTALPFVIKAVVESLKEHPLLNSTWRDGKIILKKRINIGVAAAAPEGLVVPVIHDADAMSVARLNKAVRDLADRARQNKLTLADVQGGTFSVNNTGAIGTIISRPIINHPQAAILTTETIQKRPVVINDAITIRSMMNLCLSFDHRILDGAEVGTFLQSVKRKLERMGADTPLH
ncbi:MAG: 2-oxo acid dehydrogenase subunit E2 [SAR202 cluster bacterium]|nr:2-oxo acid dehydrogenase subunit E2 [SAR202 cluster bacterium]